MNSYIFIHHGVFQTVNIPLIKRRFLMMRSFVRADINDVLEGPSVISYLIKRLTSALDRNYFKMSIRLALRYGLRFKVSLLVGAEILGSRWSGEIYTRWTIQCTGVTILDHLTTITTVETHLFRSAYV